jgi:hypothetical protein
MRHELRTEIDLAADPAAVWAALLDLPSYSRWNPFITRAVGTPEVGQRLELRMKPPGGRAVTFRPTVTEAESCRVFEWLGHLGVPGLFDGRHRFELHRTESGTKLVQTESFRGLLVRPMRRSLDGPTLAGFESMNEALARHVLAGARSA